MKRFLLATVSIAALTSATRAADMPSKAPIYMPAPVADWTGPYLGVQGGVVRRDALAELGLGFEFDGSGTGGTAGAMLGHNWQQGRFVYGIEGDWSWIGAKAAHLTNLRQFSTSFDVNWLSTIRGRAGLALDSTVFYLTGGVAFGRVNNTFTFLDGDGDIGFSFTQNRTKAGWTVGAGIEHMFAPNWTARAEWRYIDFGKTGVACTPGTNPCEQPPSGEFSNALMLGLIGVNYKFGGSHAPYWSAARAHAPLSVPIWAGGYLGIQGGLAHHDAFFNNTDLFFGLSTTSLHEREKTGGTVSGLLGYNWQQGSFVYGLEGDWSWIGARTSQLAARNTLESLSTSFDVNWLATLRGRAGLAFDSTLVYVTGGVAFGHVNNRFNLIFTPSSGVASFTENKTKVGWTAGVGVEHMFSQHWTARAEFRYVDLGRSRIACSSATDLSGCVSSGYRGDFSNTLKLGLVGLAYKF
jgi:outer membrane immunogenic protein